MLAGPSDLVDLLECEHRSYLGREERAGDPAELQAQAARTAAEMRSGAELIEDAVFFDDGFHCTVRTLVLTPDGYEPCAEEATPLAVLSLTAAAQTIGAERAHLLVDGRRTSFRIADFAPLLGRLKNRLAKPSPAPKRSWGDVRAACNGCRFARHCASGREEARDLSLVAGLRADQRRKLVSAGIDTIDALAATEERPATLSPASFTALTAQARLQVQQERTGVTTYEVVAPEALRNLPEPAEDDVFLEVDGDTFATPGWEGTFAEFVDRTPTGTVYHFTPHDLTGRAARTATKESEVDELVRRCVDLGALTRRVIRVSTREYTLQALKPLLDDEILTRGVRDLLEKIKREHGVETAARDEEVDEAYREKAAERARRMAALTEPLIAEGHALFAATVGYHRREASPAWGDFFRQASAPISDLETDSNCAVPITLRAEDWVPPSGRTRTHKRQVHARIDPERPHPFGPGEQVRLLYPGNVTRNAVVADDNPNQLVLTESNSQEHSELPIAVLPGSPVPAAPKDEAVAELAEQAISLLPLLPRSPGIDLLLRTPPGPLPQHDDVVQAVIKAVDQLDGGTLAVQGPPGAGKTYLATKLIAHLIDQGKTVAVTSTSHKAVENVLRSVDREIPMAKRPKGKPEEDVPWDQPKDNGKLAGWRAEHPQGHLVGGTAWTFSNTVIKAQPFDVMIIDEAGQFALADAVAVATAARNLVLLGDPQQLPQVVQGVHPPGSDASALGHLLGDAEVIPDHLGYFLAETRRMHPAVCRPVSELSYAGLLHSHETARNRSISGIEPGIYLREVDHRHNITSSAEEADAVVDVVRSLVGRTWTDNGETRDLTDADILVVAPYNLQVRVIRRRLADAGFDETRVGTVDRFQGQEAPAVIMSMTSSSTVDLPRGLDFLLSRNRLNVALSRAQALAVLICSPRLLDADVRGVDQMRLVAGMLGLLESVTEYPR